MKERPILMSAPMVRALLDGTKTQTRRAIKRPERFTNIRDCGFCSPYGEAGDRLWVRETFALEHAVESDQPPPHDDGRPIKRPIDDPDGMEAAWIQPHYRATDPAPDLCYEGDEDQQPRVKWRPSIFMPRAFSRITLEVCSVRVERLEEISEEDAKAEGAEPFDVRPLSNGELCSLHLPICDANAPFVTGYSRLWDQINGRGSWEKNPWVWVVMFRRL